MTEDALGWAWACAALLFAAATVAVAWWFWLRAPEPFDPWPGDLVRWEQGASRAGIFLRWDRAGVMVIGLRDGSSEEVPITYTTIPRIVRKAWRPPSGEKDDHAAAADYRTRPGGMPR